MFLILGIALLLFLSSPWNFLGLWHRSVRGRRHVVGAQTLIGAEATVTEPCRPDGQVRLNGELWEARCAEGADRDETVRVTGREGLKLLVERLA